MADFVDSEAEESDVSFLKFPALLITLGEAKADRNCSQLLPIYFTILLNSQSCS